MLAVPLSISPTAKSWRLPHRRHRPRREASQSSVEHSEPVSAADISTTRPGTKQTLLITMLGRKTGESLVELANATGWRPHTTRAALTGLCKKGKAIASEKVDGITRYPLGRAA